MLYKKYFYKLKNGWKYSQNVFQINIKRYDSHFQSKSFHLLPRHQILIKNKSFKIKSFIGYTVGVATFSWKSFHENENRLYIRFHENENHLYIRFHENENRLYIFFHENENGLYISFHENENALYILRWDGPRSRHTLIL